ncbi:hypothetical protein ACHAXT_008599 [Thalassiosira profunda]
MPTVHNVSRAFLARHGARPLGPSAARSEAGSGRVSISIRERGNSHPSSSAGDGASNSGSPGEERASRSNGGQGAGPGSSGGQAAAGASAGTDISGSWRRGRAKKTARAYGRRRGDAAGRAHPDHGNYGPPASKKPRVAGEAAEATGGGMGSLGKDTPAPPTKGPAGEGGKDTPSDKSGRTSNVSPTNVADFPGEMSNGAAAGGNKTDAPSTNASQQFWDAPVDGHVVSIAEKVKRRKASVMDDSSKVTGSVVAPVVGARGQQKRKASALKSSPANGDDTTAKKGRRQTIVSTEKKAGRWHTETTIDPTTGRVKNTGRWTDDEHRLFLEGLEEYGEDSWDEIATLVKSRTAEQTRGHAIKHFQKQEKAGGVVGSANGEELEVATPEGELQCEHFQDTTGSTGVVQKETVTTAATDVVANSEASDNADETLVATKHSKEVQEAEKYDANEEIFAWDRGVLYEAKILRCKEDTTGDSGAKKYLVHYLGFKKSHDRWLTAKDLLKKSESNRRLYLESQGLLPEEANSENCTPQLSSSYSDAAPKDTLSVVDEKRRHLLENIEHRRKLLALVRDSRMCAEERVRSIRATEEEEVDNVELPSWFATIDSYLPVSFRNAPEGSQLKVSFDNGQLVIEARPGLRLFDVRNEILEQQDMLYLPEDAEDGRFFFRVDDSVVSKKSEHLGIDSIMEEGLPVQLVTRSALEKEVCALPVQRKPNRFASKADFDKRLREHKALKAFRGVEIERRFDSAGNVVKMKIQANGKTMTASLDGLLLSEAALGVDFSLLLNETMRSLGLHDQLEFLWQALLDPPSFDTEAASDEMLIEGATAAFNFSSPSLAESERADEIDKRKLSNVKTLTAERKCQLWKAVVNKMKSAVEPAYEHSKNVLALIAHRRELLAMVKEARVAAENRINDGGMVDQPTISQEVDEAEDSNDEKVEHDRLLDEYKALKGFKGVGIAPRRKSKRAGNDVQLQVSILGKSATGKLVDGLLISEAALGADYGLRLEAALGPLSHQERLAFLSQVLSSPPAYVACQETRIPDETLAKVHALGTKRPFNFPNPSLVDATRQEELRKRNLTDADEDFAYERKRLIFQAVAEKVKTAANQWEAERQQHAAAAAANETAVDGSDAADTAAANETIVQNTEGTAPTGVANVAAQKQPASRDHTTATQHTEGETPAPVSTGLMAATAPLKSNEATTSLHDGREFIARVKQSFSDRPELYSDFLKLSKQLKSKEVDKMAWAQKALKLLEGHSDLTLGLFSIALSDNIELKANSLEWGTKSLVAVMERAPQQQVSRVSNMLVWRISKFVENPAGPLDLGSLLQSIVAADSRYTAVLPTKEALRAVMWACYQSSGEGRMSQAPPIPSGAPNAEMQQWLLTVSLWLAPARPEVDSNVTETVARHCVL